MCVEQWCREGVGAICIFSLLGMFQMPDQFDQAVVVNQLRYSGMLETVRIRKAGYAVRRPFQDFYKRQDRAEESLVLSTGIGKGAVAEGDAGRPYVAGIRCC